MVPSTTLYCFGVVVTFEGAVTFFGLLLPGAVTFGIFLEVPKLTLLSERRYFWGAVTFGILQYHKFVTSHGFLHEGITLKLVPQALP